MPAITLVDGNAASLFTISQDDWTAINKRVGFVNKIAPIIVPAPILLALVSACQGWASATFQQIVDLSGRIGAFSQEAVAQLAAVQQTIAPLKDPLPPDVAAAIQATFADLAQRAADVNAACAGLTPQVTAFVTANKNFDAEYRPSMAWDDIPLATFDDAVSRILGAWDAIAGDLGNVAGSAIPLSIKILLSLDIASAVAGWTNVGAEATAFQPLAAGQQQYYTGAFLVTPP